MWPWHTQRVCCRQNHGGKSRTKEGHTASANYARKQKRMNLEATGRIIGSARTFTSRLLLQSYCHRWMEIDSVNRKKEGQGLKWPWNHQAAGEIHMLISSSSTTKSLSSEGGKETGNWRTEEGQASVRVRLRGSQHTKQRPVQKGTDPPQWFIEALIIQVYINRSTVNSGRSLGNLQALK